MSKKKRKVSFDSIEEVEESPKVEEKAEKKVEEKVESREYPQHVIDAAKAAVKRGDGERQQFAFGSKLITAQKIVDNL